MIYNYHIWHIYFRNLIDISDISCMYLKKGNGLNKLEIKFNKLLNDFLNYMDYFLKTNKKNIFNVINNIKVPYIDLEYIDLMSEEKKYILIKKINKYTAIKRFHYFCIYYIFNYPITNLDIEYDNEEYLNQMLSSDNIYFEEYRMIIVCYMNLYLSNKKNHKYIYIKRINKLITKPEL